MENVLPAALKLTREQTKILDEIWEIYANDMNDLEIEGAIYLKRPKHITDLLKKQKDPF